MVSISPGTDRPKKNDRCTGSLSDVVLVNMPFAPLPMPSIALGLLKAAMDRRQVRTKVYYFSLDYANQIGEPLYTEISQETHPHDLVGEWIFSNSLFNHQSSAEVGEYVTNVLKGKGERRSNLANYYPPASDELVNKILSAREQVELFLERCLSAILSCKPKVVGFTSAFLQHVASLSLASRIKACTPDVHIVFGGANCEGIMGMELIRQFDFVDAAVSGEGDNIFPMLVHRLLNHEPFADLPGVLSRRYSRPRLLNGPPTHTAPVHDMDALPIPDYNDYFDQLARTSLNITDDVQVLFETSRGCWWGEKHHCTFCGLNGETMAHRSKSPQRALDELVYLSTRYPGLPVRAVDNILDMRYFKDFIPLLAGRNLNLKLFYEVKANLKKEQVRQLRDAGVTVIQPGIESLSDRVLAIMRKGVRALQNIQLLKWCKELGVHADWNLLWGFPGEPEEEYNRMAELIPLITHLQPPEVCLTLRLDRFSPNFDEPEDLGFVNVAPYPAYGYVYPFPEDVLTNLAYFFTFEYRSHQDVERYVKPLEAEIGKWREYYGESRLFWVESKERLLIWDSRPIAHKRLFILAGREKFIYMACDEVITPRRIAELSKVSPDGPLEAAYITNVLEFFTISRLMIKQDDSYLALAVPGLSA